jgi:hypothetical protein
MLETDASENRPQLGGRSLTQPWSIKTRLFYKQNTIIRTRRKESEHAAGRPGAGDREVIQAHPSSFEEGAGRDRQADRARLLPFFLFRVRFLAAGGRATAATSTAAGAVSNSVS